MEIKIADEFSLKLEFLPKATGVKSALADFTVMRVPVPSARHSVARSMVPVRKP